MKPRAPVFSSRMFLPRWSQDPLPPSPATAHLLRVLLRLLHLKVDPLLFSVLWARLILLHTTWHSIRILFIDIVYFLSLRCKLCEGKDSVCFVLRCVPQYLDQGLAPKRCSAYGKGMSDWINEWINGWMSSGWWGSVDGMLADEPKGLWFDYQSGHMPGL